MKPILVLYATREGQTKRIVDHVAATLLGRGLAVDVREASNLPAAFVLRPYRAAILAASIHVGRHEREMVAFVREHLGELERMPTAFLSVSLTEAGAEDTKASAEKRAQATAEVHEMLEAFFKETSWHPDRVSPVAGALLYREYGLIVRFVMKQIAKRAGGDTDTSRNHEYTDWSALDRFIDDLELAPDPHGEPAAAPEAPSAAPEQPSGEAGSHDEKPHPHHHGQHVHVISPAESSTAFLNPGAVTIRR